MHSVCVPSAFVVDFELQVSIVECLYRLTSAAERASLATKWFNDAPSSVIQQFTSIREAEFEVVSKALPLSVCAVQTALPNMCRTVEPF